MLGRFGRVPSCCWSLHVSKRIRKKPRAGYGGLVNAEKFDGPKPSERLVTDIRQATRKQYSAEEKIRIVLDGLCGEHSIAELCRREGIAESLYCLFYWT
jgi:hypothetical protein